MTDWSDHALAHLGLRLVLGVNISMHGLVRVFTPVAFADNITSMFAETPLPAELVFPFAIALPFVELAIGLAVLVGLRLRMALLAGLGLMAVLTFGTCLREAWESAGLQLFYAIAYWVLLAHASEARLTLDSWLDGSSRQ